MVTSVHYFAFRFVEERVHQPYFSAGSQLDCGSHSVEEHGPAIEVSVVIVGVSADKDRVGFF